MSAAWVCGDASLDAGRGGGGESRTFVVPERKKEERKRMIRINKTSIIEYGAST